MSRPLIKVCCIKEIDEALLALSFNVDSLGFVGPMPSGPGVVPIRQIKKIISKLPSGTDSVLLSSALDIDEFSRQLDIAKPSSLQIVDDVSIEVLEKLKMKYPELRLIQVIHVWEDSDARRATMLSPYVDALLLDSGKPNAEIKTLGGTGQTHDWEVSKKICAEANVPTYLAGGLNAGNVSGAIETVSPTGLDVCSGVRTNGDLDEHKLKAFISAIGNAAP